MTVNSSHRRSESPPAFEALRQVLGQLARAAIVPRAGAALAGSENVVRGELRDAVIAEVPAFSSSHNPQVIPALERHIDEHVSEIRRLMGGGEVGDFAFVRLHARQRAEQRFPLEATLHAYRCGQKAFSHWLRDAAVSIAARSRRREQAVSAVADFAIEYTNAVSTAMTSEYVAHTRALAEADGDLRKELLEILLGGYDESDGRVAQLLRRAGFLEQRQSYCVVVAQSANAQEMESRERAQRIARAVTDEFAGTSIRTLAGQRAHLVTFVMSAARRQSGWTAPQAALADRVEAALRVLGPAVLLGISADHPSTAFLPRALQEATSALEFASVTRRVVQFSRLPIRALLVHRGADFVRSTPPPWVAAFVDADAKQDGEIVRTLRAVADADMNVQQAARALGKHPNTVYGRLQRIAGATGLDPRRYRDITELLLAAECWRR